MRKIILFFFCVTLFSIGYGQSYKVHLDKINEFLKTFDNGYYGYLEIKDGYLYDRYQSGKYSKSKISDFNNATEEQLNRKVVLRCKGEGDCVFSTYTDSYHKQLSFSTATDFNTSEFIKLLNNLVSSYTNTSSSNTNVVSFASDKPTYIKIPEMQESPRSGNH